MLSQISFIIGRIFKVKDKILYSISQCISVINQIVIKEKTITNKYKSTRIIF